MDNKTKTKKAIQVVLISLNSVVKNEYYDIIRRELNIIDLFC